MLQIKAVVKGDLLPHEGLRYLSNHARPKKAVSFNVVWYDFVVYWTRVMIRPEWFDNYWSNLAVLGRSSRVG